MVAKNEKKAFDLVQDNQRPCGLIVKLEKEILWSEHCGSTPILGYFDHMDIQKVDKWLNFSPRTTAVELYNTGRSIDKNGRPPLDDQSSNALSTYPIKLIFPEPKVMSDLEDKVGFNFSVWRNDLPTLLKEYPCLTVILINLTDEFKGPIPRDPCGNQLMRLANTIKNGQFLSSDIKFFSYDKDLAQNANLCILPSLGYSDYCILLAEKSWSFATQLVEFLHRASFEKHASDGSVVQEKVPILSTDYVIPAYHVCEKSYNNIYHEHTQLSMKIHLRPGVTVLDLKQMVGDNVEVYQMSGSSDCLLEAKSETAFGKLLDIAIANHKKGDDEARKIRNLVISTEVSLRRPIPSIDPPMHSLTAAVKPSNQISNQINELRNVLKTYWQLLDKENRHMRQFNSMWDRVTAIENICRGLHNISLQMIMSPWLEAFSDGLYRFVKQAEKFADGDSRNEKQLYYILERVDDTLETFITEVGSLLADLSRSDCFFMESEHYNHASVSSATALLIAYNSWQNKFVNDVLSENPSNHSRYAFLVRSGGCDSTITKSFFHDLEPEVLSAENGNHQTLKEYIPLVTQMSEMSLFDCSGAVLRMTHECMHYCGERLRKERVNYVIAFSARYFSKHFSDILFNKVNYPEHIIKELKEKFLLEDDCVSASINAAWECGIHQLYVNLDEWINKELQRCYKDDSVRWDEKNYLSENFAQWMLEKLTFLLYPYDSEGETCYYNRFVELLCRTQRIVVRKFYDDCDIAIRKKWPYATYLALDRRQVEEYLQKADSYIKGDILKYIVVSNLSQMFMDPIYRDVKPDLQEGFQGQGLIDILQKVVFDCFSECFADLEACRRLNANLSDYLLAFIFENWDVQDAIPLEAPHSFRIPAILRVCFADDLNSEGTSLKKRAADSLKNALECLVNNGMPRSRNKATELIDHVNSILKQYKLCEWIAEPLENYLRKCDQLYLNDEPTNINMIKYQKAFKQIRLSDCRSSSDIARLFTCLISIGEGTKNGSGI